MREVEAEPDGHLDLWSRGRYKMFARASGFAFFSARVSKRSTWSWMRTATRHLHYAPYLDYRPLAADEPGVKPLPPPECTWINRELEHQAQGYTPSRTSS